MAQPFGTFADLVALQAAAQPDATAIVCEGRTISYGELDDLANRVAAALQRDGVQPRGVAAICAHSSIAYAAVFIGTLRAGAAISPLAPSATPAQLRAMVADSAASHLFTDVATSSDLAPVAASIEARRVALEKGAAGVLLEEWLPPPQTRPAPVAVDPDQAFNIIYSSGTTGTPKGIVQPFSMRWNHVGRWGGYGPGSVTMISTGLYSNTTLVCFLPALATGGTVVLMPKFDAHRFLELSEQHRANYAMLVPVQYRRIMDLPDFDSFDLSSYIMKFATSAPFAAELKADVLRRWPGGLTEWYGMTEGGGSCQLLAHEHPDKLHTVGQPMDGHEMFVIDEAGNRLPPDQVGEVVGRSTSMMNGYHNQPGKTAEAEWWSPAGERYIRTGDLASVDADGFFTLVGRKKDMIISGGINIYPVDLEAALLNDPAVKEAAVVGAPSREWGETPVGFVTLHPGAEADGEALRAAANAHLGKMQRLSAVHVVDELPRSAIGKILKRELQDRLARATA
ncbi:class I adenylate-forming enzyme family protein [Sphingopyxis sp. 113P3]|uniref:class I adenylate-forming enzyme family protein n=1 Tax=Sphingopyxis sp. (strain 113P3) TaxID=292913 RepID=UPI0006AD5904|nr:class I adenylate-forming enzyme family protein [Sphingopyxis sp. 113P3]